MIKKIYNNFVLLFYSFLFKRLFLTKILKINIITLDIICYTGTVKKLGGVAGSAAGLSLSSCGIPPFIGGPLGAIVGAFIGNIIDEELLIINKKIKHIDNKNTKNEQLDSFISSRINEKVNELLNKIVQSLDNIEKDKQSSNDKDIICYLMEQIRLSNDVDADILLKLLDDPEIKTYLIKLIDLKKV